MKKDFKSVARLLLVGAVITTGAAFTSCSDESDLDAQSSTKGAPAQSEVTKKANGAFEFTDASDNTITVNVNDTLACVARGITRGTTPHTVNARLEYTNSYSGNLIMEDGTLSTKQVPFMITDDILRLDFDGTDVFDGNTVFLTRNDGKHSLTSGDAVADAISSTATQNAMKAATKALIKDGLGTIFPKTIIDITSPILDLLLPSTASVPSYNAQFVAIEDKLNEIDSHIETLAKAIHQRDLKEDYKKHWALIKNMNTNVRQTKELLKNNAEDSVSILDQFSKSSFDGNTMSAYIETIIEGYFTSFGRTNCMNDIDEYLVTSYPFLSYSTPERLLYRAEDLKAICETTQLMYKYWLVKNCPGNAAALETKMEKFMEKFSTASRFNAHPNEVVCTIPGAYCAMGKTVGVKKFGEKEFAKGYFLPQDYGYTKAETLTPAWGSSYVYSERDVNLRMTELNDKCLKYDEAQAIYNYFGNTSLYDILKNEGVTGLDDANGLMLLGDWSYVDVERCWSSFNFHVMTRVWDNKNNTYNGNYEIDTCVRTGKSLRMNYHNSNPWAYYTKVSDHFYKTENNKQVKDYDAFMQFIWQDPGEDASDNPHN